MKFTIHAWRLWAGILILALAGAAWSAEGQGRYEEVPGVRQPTLRRIHSERDASVIERIEICRARLPAQYRERFNFAWAVAGIKGLDKAEYYAHSSIQSLDDFSREMAAQMTGISLRPEKGRYHTLCVNQNDVIDGSNCWQRTVDTEYKILEDMVRRLPDTTVKGRVKLYTDLPPCASCWNVMKQFMAEYPNVHVQVLYKQR